MENIIASLKPLEIEMVKLSPDPKNARKHNRKNIDAIKFSFQKFGQRKPIVVQRDKKGVLTVRAGNGSLVAAQELGWTKIAATIIDEDNKTASAYAIADNRTAELAEWDDLMLPEVLLDLKSDFDLGDLGWDSAELKDLFDEPKKGNIGDDDVPDVPKNIHNVTRGQVWKLGEHRLMCGDSTVEADVAKLMDGHKADMIFTDPPYNQEVNGGDFDGIQKHKNLSAHDINDFDPLSFLNIVDFLNPASFYVHCNKALITDYIKFADDKKRLWDLLAIVKNNPIPLKGNNFLSDIEWIILSRIKGSYFDDTLEFDWYRKAQRVNIKPNEFGHPTEKWVPMIEQYLQISSIAENIVVDLFLGSGSTLIACEKTNRKCFGMELDEHYCSVVIERWQQFTGKKAELLE